MIKKSFHQDYLQELDRILKKNGYKPYKQKYKNSTAQYWKELSDAVLFGALLYNFSEYDSYPTRQAPFRIQFECIISDGDIHYTLSDHAVVDKDITEFENHCLNFYKSVK